MILLKKSCLGIDVGLDTIRVVELLKKRKRYHLRFHGTSFSRHNKHALDCLLTQCHAKRAVMCLPASQTVRASLTLNETLSPLEMEYHIEQTLENIFSNITRYDYYDYHVDVKTKNQISIQLCAIPQANAEQYIKVIKAQHIQLCGLLIDEEVPSRITPGIPYTLSRAYALSHWGLSA